MNTGTKIQTLRRKHQITQEMPAAEMGHNRAGKSSLLAAQVCT